MAVALRTVIGARTGVVGSGATSTGVLGRAGSGAVTPGATPGELAVAGDEAAASLVSGDT